jgi:hypothetical protein
LKNGILTLTPRNAAAIGQYTELRIVWDALAS